MHRKIFLTTAILVTIVIVSLLFNGNNNKNNDDVEIKQEGFKVVSYPTPNFTPNKKNSVKGVILHHTASSTVHNALKRMADNSSGKPRVGTHCAIDTDGTRYIMCEPEVVTYHAGQSILNGKEGCNNFTIGIEFQGNTLKRPLTERQIKSAIEYLKPIITKYKIPVENIVTHEMVRKAYKKKYPEKDCADKVDITQTEYKRFMKELKANL